MSKKVTVIGRAPAVASRAPTRIGGSTPTTIIGQPAQAPSVTPTRITPTAIGVTTPVKAGPTTLPSSVTAMPKSVSAEPAPTAPRGPTRMAPSSVPQSVAQERPTPKGSPSPSSEQSPRVPHAITALPGARRLPLVVTLEQLQALFPQCEESLLPLIRRKIASAPALGGSPMQWLKFGERQQAALSELIKKRLSLTADSATRLTPALLGQLKNLLTDVVESLDGSLFRKATHKVWTEKRPEVEMLEKRLTTELPNLHTACSQLDVMREEVARSETHLRALLHAGDFLEKQADGAVAHHLAPRMASLLASQAMALEQLTLFEAEREQLHALAILVQDGVLVQLPSVYSLLATIGPKPNETQKLLLTETLSKLMLTLDRKN